MKEKRRHMRYSPLIEVFYVDDNGIRHKAKKVKDISAGGVSFYSSEKLSKNSNIDLDIKLEDSNDIVKAVGQVGWTEEIPSLNTRRNQYLVGIIFAKVQDEF